MPVPFDEQQRAKIIDIARLIFAHDMPLRVGLRAIERETIRIALRKCNNSIARTARALRIHRNTLARKMDEYGIA